eukprot:TRINITY_DN66648_c0_g1_i1.p1 TRINITY_DN66648_c0_g1~~TRINITY_DN66648_c0_g1_i1.p1  ORF type:complete len:289 (-),score=70.36 TRINITY_DN66648_c0_g1_i1:143-988(-)
MATGASCPPPAALCVSRDSNGYRRLRASRDVRTGEALVTEEPLLYVPGDPSTVIMDAPGGDALLEAGRALGDIRPLGAYAAYAALSAERRRAVDVFRGEAGSAPFRAARGAVERMLAADPALAAAADWPEVLRLLAIMISNAVQLQDGGLALFEYIASGNHACEPNCEIVRPQVAGPVRSIATLRSLRAVAAGDELTYSYVPSLILLAPTKDRRDFLRIHRGFRCHCNWCQRAFARSRLRKRIWRGAKQRQHCSGFGVDVKYFEGRDELDIDIVKTGLPAT